jgi:hypothetical protein
VAPPKADRLLSLAAAPTFAVMALLTANDGGLPLLCSATHPASHLTGMTVMYLLMSVFHAPPWLRLVVGRRLVPQLGIPVGRAAFRRQEPN